MCPTCDEQPFIDREAAIRRLMDIQRKSGLSKAAFAESIGIPKSNFRMIETGQRFLTVDQVYRLFVRHGVPMEYLLLGLEKDLPDNFR